MSIVSADRYSSTCSEADDGSITYDVVWQVRTNDVSDGPRQVLAATGLPKRGDTYTFGNDTDAFASCRSRSASYVGLEDTRRLWHVNLQYSTRGSSQNPDDNSNSPADPIDWSWKCKPATWHRMVAPDKDIDGRNLANAADEPFLPPPEVDKPLPMLILDKNHPTFDLADWAAAVGKVHPGELWGLAARAIKLKVWTAEPHWLGGGAMYFAHHMELEIEPTGHYFKPPNMGHREWFGNVDSDGKKIFRECLDELGVPHSRPQPLLQDGQRAPLGSPPLFFDQVAGPMARFKLEDEYDLSPILPAVLPGNFV